jgi:PAS domain S-box-containing protein
MEDSSKTREELLEELEELRLRVASLVASESRRDSAQRLSAVQHEVTRILAEADRLSDIVVLLLQTICEGLGWKRAILWGVDWQANLLRRAAVWPAPFKAEEGEETLPLGAGFMEPEMAGSKVALKAVAIKTGFDYLINSPASRLQGDIACPILSAGEVLGVIEFFTGRTEQLDEDLLGLMANIGNQIGRFIERARVEEALPETEERYRIVTEAASDAMITIDQEGIILYTNRSAERIFGYEAQDIVGNNITMLIPEYLRPTYHATIQRHIAGDKKQFLWERTELPGLHRNGKQIQLEITFGESVKDGKRIFIGIARDITERKQLERERAEILAREKEARRAAEEANQSKDEFLATVSHELRTPLTAILGWARMLDRDGINEATRTKAIEAIVRNAKSQAQIINDLLDYSRITMGKLRLDTCSLEPAPIIRSAIDAISPAAIARGVNLELSLDPDTGPILADAERLKQIIWNLLSNAIKFTPKGGRIDVVLERDESQIRIIVRDSGEGIRPDFLPHVFERFLQADGTITRKYGGLGLGLAIVRNLVELHGGTVHAYSGGEGKGATFTVKLPLLSSPLGLNICDPNPLNISKDLPHRYPELERLRVLVVDDEPDARDLYSLVLQQCGASVASVGSAVEALAMIDCWQPDLLISDIGMPVEDGYALIRKLRSRPPERGGRIPAVALTAYTRDQDCQQALLAGFQRHISKPVEPDELVLIVADLARPSRENHKDTKSQRF